MSAGGLTRETLLEEAAARFAAWDRKLNGEVIGPVAVAFTLSFDRLADATALEQFLLTPQPDIVWLGGAMSSRITPRGTERLWTLEGMTQDVWFTERLLQGFLGVLWDRVQELGGVVERWEFDAPYP